MRVSRCSARWCPAPPAPRLRRLAHLRRLSLCSLSQTSVDSSAEELTGQRPWPEWPLRSSCTLRYMFLVQNWFFHRRALEGSPRDRLAAAGSLAAAWGCTIAHSLIDGSRFQRYGGGGGFYPERGDHRCVASPSAAAGAFLSPRGAEMLSWRCHQRQQTAPASRELLLSEVPCRAIRGHSAASSAVRGLAHAVYGAAGCRRRCQCYRPRSNTPPLDTQERRQPISWRSETFGSGGRRRC